MIKRRTLLRLLAVMLTLPIGVALAHAQALPPGVNPDLPIHQQKKRHPEISDPVLGDRCH